VHGRVFHLAYHDTLAAPERVAPHRRVWAEFAPRERCYAHALDDAACATNRPYRAAFERHLERFDGRVEVFEYYGDAILFGGCGVPLPGVVERDLAYYARAGARGASCLVFGAYSSWAYGVNLEAFARGVRDPAAGDAVAAYCARRYGAAAAAAARYLAALEPLAAGLVTQGDVLLPARNAARVAALERLLAAGPALAAMVGAALAEVPNGFLAAEPALLRYTLAVAAALRDWLTDPDAEAAERTARALEAALGHVREAGASLAGTWGAYDLEVTHHFFAAARRAQSP
jgi:hypothetical protein